MYADRMVLPIERVLAINGLDDALCALRAVKGHDGAIRLFACYCARYCLGIFERKYPDEKRPHQAMETAERHARGQATDEELAAARAAAFDACDECDVSPWRFEGNSQYDWLVLGIVTRFLARLLTRLFARFFAMNTRADLAAWSACSAKAADAARDAAKRIKGAAGDDVTREFLRLCRLGGEYGAVSERARQSGEAAS